MVKSCPGLFSHGPQSPQRVRRRSPGLCWRHASLWSLLEMTEHLLRGLTPQMLQLLPGRRPRAGPTGALAPPFRCHSGSGPVTAWYAVRGWAGSVPSPPPPLCMTSGKGFNLYSQFLIFTMDTAAPTTVPPGRPEAGWRPRPWTV